MFLTLKRIDIKCKPPIQYDNGTSVEVVIFKGNKISRSPNEIENFLSNYVQNLKNRREIISVVLHSTCIHFQRSVIAIICTGLRKTHNIKFKHSIPKVAESIHINLYNQINDNRE